MGIRVASGAADLPGDLAGRFLVLVRGTDSPDRALAGLEAARAAFLGLGPAMVSPVVLSPAGPLLRVGGLEAGEEELHSVPSLVVAALEEAGVVDAEVEVLDTGGPLDALDLTANAVVLRLFPAPAGADGTIPLEWLEVATDWVLGDTTADEAVDLRLLGMAFEVVGRDVAATLHAAVAARTWCDLVQGRLDHRIRTASLTFGHAPHLALAAGGPGCDSAALLARLHLLEDVARDVPAAYACVDIEETFAGIGTGLGEGGWAGHGGASPNQVAAGAGDVVVPDAFPFQILGPGHLRRLSDRGHEELDAEPLEDGRAALALGDPIDWLPRYETRADAVEHATKALEDLLVSDAELAELVAQRPQVAPVAATDARAGVTGGPDLDHVTLDAVPHPRRGLRLTLLELASWLGHEPHSDVPRGVSPVLSAYARWYASGLGQAERQHLKHYAARLVGTRGPGVAPAPWRPLGTTEEHRAWRAADWLAREQSATWLEAAGLGAAAKRLLKVRRLADGSHRARQLKLLDAALDDLLATGGRADADPGGDVAWEAWEEASEASGWVAASEAAWVGIPDAMASAVELRALEVARVPGAHGGRRSRAKLEVAEAVGAAARAAAAEEGWRLAGEAAALAVDADTADPSSPEQVAAVPLSTAWDRAVQGAMSRTGLDRDAVELAVEEAEAQARAVLADLMEGASPPDGALEVARRAAEASPGGMVWRTVRELAAGVVGPRAWAASQAAAAEALDRVVRRAPALVERAVLVAVAREVGSLAARTAAARGGADALGASLAVLQPAALELLDDLLAVR